MGTTGEKTIYFVRHGQSVDNVSPVFQSLESPLSKVGLEQAEKIAQRISKLTFDALLSSPLPRARQTADEISKATGINPEFSDIFVERVKPSSVVGKPYTDEKANSTWRAWEKSLYTPGLRVEDGENFEDIVGRADRALDYLKERSERSIVVVTHGYFLRTIIARVLLGEVVLGDQFMNFQRVASVENTGLTIIQNKGDFEDEQRWRLITYNDHAHLAD